MSSERLIQDLSANLVPVRRRNVAREWALVLALAAIELVLILAMGAMRPDMGRAIGHPFMWWKLGSLALIVAASAITAIGSFTPTGTPRRGLAIVAGLAGLAAITGMMVQPAMPADMPVMERLAPLHGLGCMVSIILLALPMAALLAFILRRAAPTHIGGSALAVGLASASWGAFAFAFCCRANDPLYIAVWYALAGVVVAGGARALVPRGYRL
ncbi:DUF1109 domain-containing protein [Sphingomonas sp. AP4-R1]|uniref:NrsF family protein n=1 Tax=Sphingomonas sp. AP4-R1 TaxID=2735134 RepID=UPI0014936DF6|nr:DUF1109 domain-containing protein [Sphingomonas sp. AP4-R1]QJU59418.1 DUF1109 domain-containing protein [Sphingomonas sp. AP4-R1]